MRSHNNHGWRVGVWLVLTAVAGCTRSPEATAPTVTYLREHDDERRELLKRCVDDPGTLGNTPACVNAKQATIIVDVGSYRTLPKMGLPGAPTPNAPPAPADATASRP
ncbi:MAG: conserved plasmid protein [Gammaproteobacteria bacterium]|nr:conserved plasmid protein [Gammaproteobacteria bacterium]